MQKQSRILKTRSATTGGWAGFLKSPTPGSDRSSFAIVERHPLGYRTIKNKTLDTINEQFKAGKIPFERAKILALDVINQLRPQSAITHFEENFGYLKDYWDQIYESRDIVDRRSAYNRMVRAVESAGHHSLQSASREELQKEVDSRFKGNKQRAIVTALNQILKYLKRDFKLRKMREEVRSVRYLTVEELEKVLTHIKDENMRLLCRVAFATGMRVGELFAITPESVNKSYVVVDSQIDTGGIRRETKTRKTRQTSIIPAYYKYVQEWSLKAPEERLLLRNMALSKIVRRASKKALNKSYVFHDLRHSYATYLRAKGVSITLVAACLGNSVAVADKYYAARGSSEELQLIQEILN